MMGSELTKPAKLEVCVGSLRPCPEGTEGGLGETAPRAEPGLGGQMGG